MLFPGRILVSTDEFRHFDTNSNITGVYGSNMATARDVQVNPDTNEVSVQFTVHDEGLANYLAEYDDSEQADVVEHALRVGMMTLQLSETTNLFGTWFDT